MFTYTQTSKLRRKVKTKLTKLGDRIQLELTASMTDLRSSNSPLKQHLKRFITTETYSDVEFCASDNEGSKTLQRR